MEEVLTVPEVANLLKVHQSAVYRMCKSGQLPSFKLGSDCASVASVWRKG